MKSIYRYKIRDPKLSLQLNSRDPCHGTVMNKLKYNITPWCVIIGSSIVLGVRRRMTRYRQ